MDFAALDHIAWQNTKDVRLPTLMSLTISFERSPFPLTKAQWKNTMKKLAQSG
jgi:hypothetical protein